VPGTNTLAYFGAASVTAAGCFAALSLEDFPAIAKAERKILGDTKKPQ